MFAEIVREVLWGAAEIGRAIGKQWCCSRRLLLLALTDGGLSH
jgi:hypothetical protein